VNRTTRNPERSRSRSGRADAGQPARLRAALARRRLEELREDRVLRQRISDIFLDEPN